ncbi:hypothetical protein WEB32_34010 [Streptomyces netropsis]
MSANRWRRALAAGRRGALVSKEPGDTLGRLAPGQLRELESLLDASSAARPPGPIHRS